MTKETKTNHLDYKMILYIIVFLEQNGTKIINVSQFYGKISHFEHVMVKNMNLEKIAVKDQ